VGGTEGSAEYLVPGVPHELEQRRHIPIGERSFGVDAIFADVLASLRQGLVAIDGLEFALDEWPEPRFESLKRLANALMIGYGHCLPHPNISDCAGTVVALASRARRVISGQLCTRPLYDSASVARFLRSAIV